VSHFVSDAAAPEHLREPFPNSDVGHRYIRNIASAIILLRLTSERVGIDTRRGDDLHSRFSPSGKNARRQCRRDIDGI